MNAKLVKEMKLVAAKLDDAISKSKNRPKPVQVDENIKGSLKISP